MGATHDEQKMGPVHEQLLGHANTISIADIGKYVSFSMRKRKDSKVGSTQLEQPQRERSS